MHHSQDEFCHKHSHHVSNKDGGASGLAEAIQHNQHEMHQVFGKTKNLPVDKKVNIGEESKAFADSRSRGQ